MLSDDLLIFIMPEFRRTYKIVLILFLSILVNVPCFLKKELTQLFNVETQQNSSPASGKIACASYCSVQEEKRQEQVKEQSSTIHFSTKRFNPVPREIRGPEIAVYYSLKEKIPSYLLHRRFLI